MVTLKKKISNTLNSNLIHVMHEGSVKRYSVNPFLVEAVRVFQEALKIKTRTTVTLKKKQDIWADQNGCCFFNHANNMISCHIYVHRHSTVLGTLILIAHEMVHAWQIDTKQPGKKAAWEKQAVEMSLLMVEELHIKRYPKREESLARAEVHMAWGWVH
jgi:hypothetical protein